MPKCGECSKLLKGKSIDCNGGCTRSFHIACADVDEEQSSFICKMCESIQSSEYQRLKRKRAPYQHDQDPEDKWGSLLQEKSKNGCFKPFEIQKIQGHEFTVDWIRRTKFLRPVLVQKMDGLDMKMPTNLTPQLISEIIGNEFEVDAINVETQSEERFTLKAWAEYFNGFRTKIYNVLSLEFSQTNLMKRVMRPRIVRDIDILQFWPESRKTKGFPTVQHYCLMSVEASFTDFHIDFGGTSVFYHVLKGKKMFLLVEPDSKNLKLYEEWLNLPNGTFFSDLVDNCYELTINAGETVMLPSGWIHAVYTPVDSIVIGGNFLHLQALEMQIAVHSLERRISMQEKFLFPWFDDACFYCLEHYSDVLFKYPDTFSRHEVDQLLKLSKYLSLSPSEITKSFDYQNFNNQCTLILEMWNKFVRIN